MEEDFHLFAPDAIVGPCEQLNVGARLVSVDRARNIGLFQYSVSL